MASSHVWADVDEDEDTLNNDDIQLPESTVTIDDKGVKTITSYRIQDGERQKVIRRVKTVTKKKKISRKIKERREWEKFGLPKGAPPGPEEETTIVSRDDIYIENPGDEAKATKREEEEVMKRLRAGAARRKFNQQMDEKQAGINAQLALSGDQAAPAGPGLRTGTALSAMVQQQGNAPAAGAGGKFVPPHLRGGNAAAQRGGDDDSESQTLRVTNISSDATEDDLRRLFERFGRIMRVYLPKDKESNQSKGFAYVSYATRESAERAKEKLHGYGYDHLILHVEWAKPSNKDDIASQNVLQKGIVSGYGGALPQGLG